MALINEFDYQSISQKVITVVNRNPCQWCTDLNWIKFPMGMFTSLYVNITRINPDALNSVYIINKITINNFLTCHTLDIAKLPMDIITVRINDLIDDRVREYLRIAELRKEKYTLKINRAIAKLHT